LVDATAPFDALSSNHSFTIASPDYLAPVFQAEIVSSVRREAPNVSLVIRALGPDFDFESALAQGDVDIVIGNWPSPPNYLRRSILLQDDIVCLMSKTIRSRQVILPRPPILEPRISCRSPIRWRIAAWSKRIFPACAPAVPAPSRSPISAARLAMLLQSDLIFSTSRHFAAYFAGFLPLVIRESPVAFPPMTFYQLWHDRTHHSPMHRWLREAVMRARGKIVVQRPAG
jgi:DNA-binding transcriptional LysR family regulator